MKRDFREYRDDSSDDEVRHSPFLIFTMYSHNSYRCAPESLVGMCMRSKAEPALLSRRGRLVVSSLIFTRELGYEDSPLVRFIQGCQSVMQLLLTDSSAVSHRSLKRGSSRGP